MDGQLDQRLDPDDLQGQLRDLLSLAGVGDHVRSVVTGEGAAELAEWLAGASSPDELTASRFHSRGTQPM